MTRGKGSRTHHLALYAGSFDPITYGHLDVLRRARHMFDELVLGLGHNPDKIALFSFEERTEMARELVEEMLREEPDATPIRVERYQGLTVDFARKIGAAAIVRGIRNITDLATETQIAITNRQVANIETVFIVTGEQFAYTSSSLIRQVVALGGSLDRLKDIVPPLVLARMRQKRDDPNNPLSKLAEDAHID
ncbi:MAG: pantetheine-phosphate adenylyltransferase [Phycisphaerales bacterium]|nr:MAG: pantetheine-phosphate adenylyltransferase [Phycisphaerales bacterium]